MHSPEVVRRGRSQAFLSLVSNNDGTEVRAAVAIVDLNDAACCYWYRLLGGDLQESIWSLQPFALNEEGCTVHTCHGALQNVGVIMRVSIRHEECESSQHSSLQTSPITLKTYQAVELCSGLCALAHSVKQHRLASVQSEMGLIHFIACSDQRFESSVVWAASCDNLEVIMVSVGAGLRHNGLRFISLPWQLFVQTAL